MEPLVLAGLGALAALVLGYTIWAVPLARARAAAAAGAVETATVAERLKAADALAGERLRERDELAGAVRTALGERDAARLAEAELSGEIEALRPLPQALEAERGRHAEARRALAALEAGSGAREAAFAEQRAGLIATGEALKAEFERLAGAALKGSQTQFLEVAAQTLTRQQAEADKGLAANKEALAGLLTPVTATLEQYQTHLRAIEQSREQAYGNLAQMLSQVADGQGRVQAEAARLTTALRTSGRTAGSWGEQQLKNVLEMAGLREGVDFELQASRSGEDGSKRPDAVVRLPGGRQLIVDSKCSLADFLNAAGADEGARREAIGRHVACVRAHMRGLAAKAYWSEFGQSADFVVMFLPGENYLSAALEQDTALLDEAFKNRILLAGPINLLAIAKTVALVWRQETLAEKAREIGELGASLYAALATMAEHVECVGEHLGKAVKAHNAMVGSLETNVLPKARRFPELGVDKGKKAFAALTPVEREPRAAASPELRVLRPPAAA